MSRDQIRLKIKRLTRSLELIDGFVENAPPAALYGLTDELEKTLDEIQPELADWVRGLREEAA